jgi:hypothetical protein
MARPTVPAVADAWYDELSVSQPADEQLGWPFLTLLAGFAAAFGELHDIVRDTDQGPGWSPVLDPARAPVKALPWLAQFAGVTLTPGATETDWREEITSPPAFQRGTPQAIIDATARTLTGDQRVALRERDGGPWDVTVITYTAQTPDPAATERAARSQKPAGLLMTFRVDPGWSVGEIETAYSTRTVGDIEAAFATVGDLESNLPV